MAHGLHFGGTLATDRTLSGEVDLSGSTYGLRVTRMALPGLAESRLDLGNAAGRHGGIAGDAWYEPLELSVPCVVLGSSYSDLRDKLDALASALFAERTQSKSLRFQWGGWTTRFWLVRLTGGFAPRPMGLTAARFELPFVAPSPLAYSTTRQANSFAVGADPTTFDVENAVAVAGTAYAEPLWEIRTAAASTSITLTNNTTGETITRAGSLNSGDWLRIDSGIRETVEKSTNSGSTWTAALTGVTAGARFPRLKPGVQNSITVTGVSSATVYVYYRARYL